MMMHARCTLLRCAARFWKSTRATLSVEAVLVLPLLVWAYAGLFTLYDGFRVKNLNLQSSFTISDLLSRETNVINDDYIDGLHRTFRLITQAREQTILRVSALRYDEADDDHVLLWSQSTAGMQDLTQGTLNEIEDHIPLMADADTLIVVETKMGFIPLMDFGIKPFFFESTVVTRPRFAPQLLYSPI